MQIYEIKTNPQVVKTQDPQVRRLWPKPTRSAEDVVSVDESGGEARTYAIDTDIILKVLRWTPLSRRSVGSRPGLLTATRFPCPVSGVHYLVHYTLSVSRVLGHERQGAMLQYTVLTRMPGAAMRRGPPLVPSPNGRRWSSWARRCGVSNNIPRAPLANSGIFPGDRGLPDIQVDALRVFFPVPIAVTDLL